jgi:hypothetical protein
MNKRVLNVDSLAFLADRIIKGVKFHMADVPDDNEAPLAALCDEDGTLCLKDTVKELLRVHFGGISL